MSQTVQTAIILSVALGVLLTVIGELIVYPAFLILDVPLDVYDMAESYLRIFLLGLPFLSLYNFEAAIFRSCGDSKTPLYSLVIANGLNIVLASCPSPSLILASSASPGQRSSLMRRTH